MTIDFTETQVATGPGYSPSETHGWSIARRPVREADAPGGADA